MIRTKYHVMGGGKAAPIETTYDRLHASMVLQKVQRGDQKGIYSIISEVEACEPLTKPEQYLLLVYDVRKLIRRYFNDGRKADDLTASLVKETQLDHWNARTRAYINSKPGFERVLKGLPQDSEKFRHFAFFQVVEEWRKVWKEYHAYRRLKDKEPDVEKEMKKRCVAFEKTIDEYIKKTLQL